MNTMEGLWRWEEWVEAFRGIGADIRDLMLGERGGGSGPTEDFRSDAASRPEQLLLPGMGHPGRRDFCRKR